MTQTLCGFPGSEDSQGNHSHPPFPAPFLIMTGSASVGSGVSFQTGPEVCGWTLLDPKPSIIFFSIFPPQLAFPIPSNSPSLRHAGHTCQPPVKARWGSSWGTCHHHCALQGSLTSLLPNSILGLASSGKELATAEV